MGREREKQKSGFTATKEEEGGGNRGLDKERDAMTKKQVNGRKWVLKNKTKQKNVLLFTVITWLCECMNQICNQKRPLSESVLVLVLVRPTLLTLKFSFKRKRGGMEISAKITTWSDFFFCFLVS